MPFAEHISAEAAAQGRAHQMSVAKKVRYGLMAARINSSQRHRLGIAAFGRKPGTLVYIDVKDGSRFPEEGELAQWRCYHPACAGKQWETKRELVNGHAEQRVLVQQQEAHVYVAVCELAAVEAKGDRPAQDARVLLLSDEE